MALNVAKRVQSVAEGIEFLFIRSRCSEKSNSGELCRLLRSRRKRPRRRDAAEQRYKLATLQLTELHPPPLTMERQDSGLASIESALAALRDFDAAFDRFGSWLCENEI
jgi:hypothetical protein